MISQQNNRIVDLNLGRNCQQKNSNSIAISALAPAMKDKNIEDLP
tara:strand:- start:335 stop:469 length:135 start_codon:yes stop_codon:yes gene_type:complete